MSAHYTKHQQERVSYQQQDIQQTLLCLWEYKQSKIHNIGSEEEWQCYVSLMIDQ
jgi:hypothetical protein